MAYLFDPDRLHQLVRKYLGQPHELMVRGLKADLAEAYPGHIETRENWLFNMAGGYVGIMGILHASLSEYVLLFGAPIGARGFSGRYLMEVFDYMLCGELTSFTEKSFQEPARFLPGDLAILPRGQAKGFKLTEGSWVLEYGRGFIPASLPFALGDALFSCFDPVTVGKTLWAYGRLVIKELWKGKI